MMMLVSDDENGTVINQMDHVKTEVVAKENNRMDYPVAKKAYHY
jgi:hypothetical protein